MIAKLPVLQLVFDKVICGWWVLWADLRPFFVTFTACYDESTDYSGANIGPPVAVNNARECQLLCEADSGCSYFTWVHPQAPNPSNNWNMCYKKDVANAMGATAITSGPKFC